MYEGVSQGYSDDLAPLEVEYDYTSGRLSGMEAQGKVYGFTYYKNGKVRKITVGEYLSSDCYSHKEGGNYA